LNFNAGGKRTLGTLEEDMEEFFDYWDSGDLDY
jgi:hypothetical protein